MTVRTLIMITASSRTFVALSNRTTLGFAKYVSPLTTSNFIDVHGCLIVKEK